MLCPRTGKEMIEVDINGVKVDVSTGCGGVWFDNFELQKFDETSEVDGQKIIELSNQYKKDDVDVDQKISCPRCKDIKLMRHFFSIERKVQIDKCGQCNGIWLDAGELEIIRKLFKNEEEKNALTDKHFQSIVNMMK